MYLLQENWCVKQANLIYTYSNEIALRYRKDNDQVKLMQDPLLQSKDIIHRDDTCQDDEIRLLRVCWLLPSKGLEYLFEAIALLLEKGLRVRLEIVGKERSPGYQTELEQLVERLGIADKVDFTGWVPFDQMEEVYLRNDINIISSLGEGTPRIIAEGFARGLPLVSTTVGGCADTLTDNENAILVPPRDGKAIAEAVEKIILNGDLRRKIIVKGYQYARAATFETLGMQFLTEIQGIYNKHGEHVDAT